MPANFIFKPIEANLVHNTDILTKMNPYCTFVSGDKRFNTQVCRHGGKRPHWNDIVTVPAINQLNVLVELMDKDKITSDDRIGSFMMDLQEIVSEGKVSKWYPLLYKNKPAGEILIESAFQRDNHPIERGVEPSNLFRKENLMSPQQNFEGRTLTGQENTKTFVEQRQHIEPYTFTKSVETVEVKPIQKRIEPHMIVRDIQYTEAVPVKKHVHFAEPIIRTKIVTKEVRPEIVSRDVGPVTMNRVRKEDSPNELNNGKILSDREIAENNLEKKIVEMEKDFKRIGHYTNCELNKY